MACELPVWVRGQELWVKGVDMKTTSNEIISALVGGQASDGYTIVEKWRGVEKPLGGLVKIYKVWSEWGDAQNEVKLTLRKTSECEGSPSSIRRRRHHPHRTKSQSQTVHPKKLSQLSKSQSIEKLLKIILVQGETIQNQLKKLNEKEAQIGKIEEEKHKARMNALGPNYVLEAYLGKNIEDEKENDSGIVTEGQNSENASPVEDRTQELNDLTQAVELWEKIVKINKKLEKEEETLVRLYIKLHRVIGVDEAAISSELKRIHTESVKYAKEFEFNNYNLYQADLLLQERRNYLHRLHQELEASEVETARLVQVNQSIFKAIYKSSLDSNSDTGLSSLHSSSEEGTYILDTVL